MRLLLVRDDRHLADDLAGTLSRVYAVDSYVTAELGYYAATMTEYDVIVLDLSVSNDNGIDLVQRLRKSRVRAPIIALTDQDRAADRVRGLDAGADDCLAKPFALPELEARIRVQTRRRPIGLPNLRFATLEIEVDHRTAVAGGTQLGCTAKEYTILELLVRAQGHPVAKHSIFEGLYDTQSTTSAEAVQVHVSRLRRKLTAANTGLNIRALRGLGYRLEKTAV